MTPLDELGTRQYRGFPGGLYPGGTSKRPEAHALAGLEQVRDVVPRNAAGAPDAQNGRIVFLSVGMSNTTQEFSVFKPLADRDPRKNPQLVIVDGAQGGWSADRIVAGGEAYWQTVAQRLAAAGVTAAQVQAAWMKQADAGPTLAFPEDARRLQRELATLALALRTRFPNLRLLYLSSRIYAGYASTTLNPEPYAYQSGFAVKWLIEQQVQGDSELSYTAGRAPWLSWGPYLWADGTRVRSDGLVWNCADFQDDGTHPADAARRKVAALLLDFLKTDITARSWFLRNEPRTGNPPQPAALVNAATWLAPVAPRAIVSIFGTDLASATVAATAVPLPQVLAGTAVDVDSIACPLLYVSPRQINLVLPAALAFSPPNVPLVVWRDSLRLQPLLVHIVGAAPGLFTLTPDPTGPAAALHADGRLIAPEAPARRGETIMLFGTGLGLNQAAPLVRIGGADATVAYAGQAPGFAGLDQINVTVPANIPLRTARVEVAVGSAASNAPMLPVE